MKEQYFKASVLREHGFDIPSHIPDHAFILERHVVAVQMASIQFGVPGVCQIPSFPADKFIYYRTPATNARQLVSRNKREGQYLGWRKLGPCKRGPSWAGRKKPGHQRIGSELMVSSLRDVMRWKKEADRTFPL